MKKMLILSIIFMGAILVLRSHAENIIIGGVRFDSSTYIGVTQLSCNDDVKINPCISKYGWISGSRTIYDKNGVTNDIAFSSYNTSTPDKAFQDMVCSPEGRASCQIKGGGQFVIPPCGKQAECIQ